MQLRRTKSISHSATSLVEVLVATLLVGVFFGSIFELNALCLHVVSASKENVGAIECVQDRLEVIRNSSFATVTTQASMKTLLTTSPNASPLGLVATETVTVSAFANGVATTPQAVYVRAPGSSVVPVVTWNPAGATFGTGTVAQVDIQYTWTSTFGGRTHSESTSTILTDGTKK